MFQVSKLDFLSRKFIFSMVIACAAITSIFSASASAVQCPRWLYNVDEFARHISSRVSGNTAAATQNGIDNFRLNREVTSDPQYRVGEGQTGRTMNADLEDTFSMSTARDGVRLARTLDPPSLAPLNSAAEAAGFGHQDFRPGHAPGPDFASGPHSGSTRLAGLFEDYGRASSALEDSRYGRLPGADRARLESEVAELGRQIDDFGPTNSLNPDAPTAQRLRELYDAFLRDRIVSRINLDRYRADLSERMMNIRRTFGCDRNPPSDDPPDDGSCGPAGSRAALPASSSAVARDATRSIVDNALDGVAGISPDLTPEERMERLVEAAEAHGERVGTRDSAPALGTGIALGSAITAIPELYQLWRASRAVNILVPATAGAALMFGSTPGGASTGPGPGVIPGVGTPSSRPTRPMTRPRSHKPGPSAESGCRYIGSGNLTVPPGTATPIRIDGGKLTFISRCFDEADTISPEDLTAVVTAREISSTKEGRSEFSPTMTIRIKNVAAELNFTPASGARASAARRALPAPAPTASDGLYRVDPLAVFWNQNMFIRSDPPTSTDTDLSSALMELIRQNEKPVPMAISASRTVSTPYISPIRLQKYSC